MKVFVARDYITCLYKPTKESLGKVLLCVVVFWSVNQVDLLSRVRRNVVQLVSVVGSVYIFPIDCADHR